MMMNDTKCQCQVIVHAGVGIDEMVVDAMYDEVEDGGWFEVVGDQIRLTNDKGTWVVPVIRTACVVDGREIVIVTSDQPVKVVTEFVDGQFVDRVVG